MIICASPASSATLAAESSCRRFIMCSSRRVNRGLLSVRPASPRGSAFWCGHVLVHIADDVIAELQLLVCRLRNAHVQALMQ